MAELNTWVLQPIAGGCVLRTLGTRAVRVMCTPMGGVSDDYASTSLRGGPRSSHCIKGGRDMFKHLTPEEQVRKLQQENRALKEHVKVLEDALVELAEIVAANEEELHNG
jgi:hypothetical protein